MSDKLIFWISFLIPGSGHILMKRTKAGVLGVLFTIAAWVVSVIFLIPNILASFVYHNDGGYEGQWTLGAQEITDDSFLILITTVFSVAVIAVFILVAYAFARDARNAKKTINSGEVVLTFKEKAKAIAPDAIPQLVIAPSFAFMFVIMFVPAIVSILIAFTNYRSHIVPPGFLVSWEGLDNFAALFSDPRLTSAFTDTLSWSLIWTFCATMLTLVLGVVLAILCNNKHIKGKKFFRTVYLLPWAVPAFLTILIFQIFFSRHGAMNSIVLPLFTGSEYSFETAVGFLLDADLAKVTVILIQGWLGFPYIYVLVTGILQTIPDDLYEAANIDGGNPWSNFWDITFPIIMSSAAPTMITQFTFNFNNVMIFYLLVTDIPKEVGSMYGPLETIASLGYNLLVQQEFSTAAVFTLLTSLVVSGVVLFSWIKTGAFKKEDVM